MRSYLATFKLGGGEFVKYSVTAAHMLLFCN